MREGHEDRGGREERELGRRRSPAANDIPCTILVNGTAHAWRPGMTVADVVRERQDDDAAVATAVNGNFVPRPARADAAVAPGDTLLVFAAIVGG
jgi:sulfur carrier protein